MNSKLIEEKKKRLKLSARQKEILVGTLLGDGHLETQDGGKTYRLKIEHTIRQKEYVDWLFQEFQEWVRTPPKERKRLITLHGRPKEYERIGFSTLSSGTLRFYAQQFYTKSCLEKTVPKLIKRWLTPLAMAVWYMDDGSIKSNTHRTVLMNTQGFKDIDLKYLQDALQIKYGIQTTVRKQKDGKQLYVPSESVDLFLRAIEPFILASMRYKLPKVWLTQLPKK